MKSTISVALGMAALTLAMAGQPAYAQATAGKALGHDYNFWETMGWQHHAQNQARSLYVYSKTAQPTAEQAKEHAAAARSSLAAAKKNVAELKKANPDNKEAQASIAKIEEIQKGLMTHCDKADKAIASGDQAAISACCADMFHDLEAANAEMKKLQKALNIATPELPKK